MSSNHHALTFNELRELPGRTVRMVLECSGNDAQFFDAQYAERFIGWMRHLDPAYQGKRWQGGLLSAGEFTGVPLASMLEKAGLRTNAGSGARAEGRDNGSPDRVAYGLPLSDKPVPAKRTFQWAHCGQRWCCATRFRSESSVVRRSGSSGFAAQIMASRFCAITACLHRAPSPGATQTVVEKKPQALVVGAKAYSPKILPGQEVTS
jgi:molybdopterin-dependent oxidoreductase-like protein protein